MQRALALSPAISRVCACAISQACASRGRVTALPQIVLVKPCTSRDSSKDKSCPSRSDGGSNGGAV
eukprot:CAMPEP_0117587376 /NCGR_PEP_ID=MMETSP0784-20121206/69262_1 /TAXON_ID=39447 /ORGANISM="" /LENGTH=65 /DNA_ID=CAMNT_0005388619 /DNA_START=6 /DNA_END=203 /DNA_ORIENTATION=+